MLDCQTVLTFIILVLYTFWYTQHWFFDFDLSWEFLLKYYSMWLLCIPWNNVCDVTSVFTAEETFFKASSLLVQWLERGDCSRRNANTFYSMIQSTNSHVRHILNQKQAYEEEAIRFKEQMKQRMQGLITQCKYWQNTDIRKISNVRSVWSSVRPRPDFLWTVVKQLLLSCH